jgi:diaminopimelate epimerase
VRSELYKLEGAGNDFLLGVGSWARRLESEPLLVRGLCDRRRGIGADGTLALEAIDADRVRLGYRNADGSEGAFCGNGTRCAARAAVELLGCPQKVVIETGWAQIPAAVDGSSVCLELPPPQARPTRVEVALPEGISSGLLVKIGVPHLVIETTGLADLDLEEVGPPLRRHAAAGPEGANVDFFEVEPGGALKVRTWERGVEAETLSCGSGMVAVALVVMAERGADHIELLPLSGDRLFVEALGAPPVCETRFTGPARFVAKIDPAEEFLRAPGS